MSEKPIPAADIVPAPPRESADGDTPVESLGDRPWFVYPIRVHPHHTDYAAVVWHGTYLQWMEEARVECLNSIGMNFAELVALGCDLPVVDLSIRYHRPLQLGITAIVKTRLSEITGVRQHWECQICSPEAQILYVSAHITLVAIDREKGKVLRKLPAPVERALMKLSE